MSFALGNYAGDVIRDLKDGELCRFSVERYKRVTGLNHPRLYLLSKCLDDSDNAISEYLQSKCASCNQYTDGLLLKTVPFPDLVVIEEECSQLVRSKDLCVICMESESACNKLSVTRCCHQFPHIFYLRRYYCIVDVCSTQDYADEVTAKLYSENCFVCCGCPEQEAPLDHFIVQHLIPEINPHTNDRRIQDANATLSSLCAGLMCKISPLFSSSTAGYLRCTYAVGQYSSVDGLIFQQFAYFNLVNFRRRFYSANTEGLVWTAAKSA